MLIIMDVTTQRARESGGCGALAKPTHHTPLPFSSRAAEQLLMDLN